MPKYRNTVTVKVWRFFATILFFILFGCQTEENNNIAKINDSYISVYEFKNILQFNPYLASIKNINIAKKTILSSLIAEKILALEAKKNGLHEEEKNHALFEQYKREAIIEKFWQEELFNKINISEEELKDAYFKSKEKRIIKFLQFENKESAQGLFDFLKENKFRFADLPNPVKNMVAIDTIEFSGKMPTIEDTVFAMTDSSMLKLVKEGKKYFVLELQYVERNIFTAKADFEFKKKKLSKILKQKKSIKKYQEYQKTHFKPYLYHLDQNIFKNLVKQMDNKIFDKTIEKNTKSKDILEIDKKSFDKEFLQSNVIKFNDNENWTIEKLLNRISLSPYPVDLESPGKFRMSMIAATKHILDDEVIVKHARMLNLEKTNYVEQESKMWQDYHLSKNMLKKIILRDSSSTNINDKVDKYLSAKIQDYQIEINKDVLDTLTFTKTDMVTLKTHFPTRTIVPSIKPLVNLTQFNQIITSKLSN